MATFQEELAKVKGNPLASLRSMPRDIGPAPAQQNQNLVLGVRSPQQTSAPAPSAQPAAPPSPSQGAVGFRSPRNNIPLSSDGFLAYDDGNGNIRVATDSRWQAAQERPTGASAGNWPQPQSVQGSMRAAAQPQVYMAPRVYSDSSGPPEAYASDRPSTTWAQAARTDAAAIENAAARRDYFRNIETGLKSTQLADERTRNAQDYEVGMRSVARAEAADQSQGNYYDALAEQARANAESGNFSIVNRKVPNPSDPFGAPIEEPWKMINKKTGEVTDLTQGAGPVAKDQFVASMDAKQKAAYDALPPEQQDNIYRQWAATAQ